ncbi:putative glycoside hydrolase/deacetylase ChbG (UPF0249 family) [Virgibacillus natechei]|uniref:Glycoside hydrolase/deacetylase ChbG (UPF0249 family) n=1 Tax=Virgibacillus natechei TaxID=1216297 RepID=A0ABS4IKR6_9BACI|nr:ChbG/HpnK family deacetylase [Virgibacillus natechei]MBP1971553.1 putative glycoside hydrolase/deacetylase ChbG (UPF0249 family) [Virgibacillus natechei]UZD11977.1 ChbG/HpnK family deacetylase [Virgibacillus natechei]
MNKSTTKVIINADDYGLTPGVSSGILYGHQKGIITSTTAMVNTEFAKQSVEDAMTEEYGNLGIGLHLVLDMGQSVSSSVNSLTDHRGFFLKGEELVQSATKRDVKIELEAQLDLLYKWGINVTHIDSHHHMHLHIPCALEAVGEVAEEYKLPIRSFSEQTIDNVLTTDYFNYDFYGSETIVNDHLIKTFSDVKPGVTEVMCHPGFLDAWLYRRSSYTDDRMNELEVLVNKRIINWFKNNSIEMIHYGDLE